MDKTSIGPNDPIYRALRGIQIPYDRERDGSLSGQQVADLAIAGLRAEGYGPEKPGSWWFVTPGGGELEGAKYWASSFGEYAGRNGDRANVGFIYEARFTERPELSLGNESYIPGRKITVVAVHVTDSNNQWQRVPIGPIQTIAKASDKGLLEGAGVCIAGSLRTDAALDNEARISVAEQVMDRAGLSGDVILVPVGHNDDPAYQAAIQPLVQWVRDLCRNSQMRFYASDYILDTEGGGSQAMTDGMNRIVVRPVTSTMTVLHEVAHVLNRSSEGRGHDDAFIDTLAGLYRKHLGDAAADQFLDIVHI